MGWIIGDLKVAYRIPEIRGLVLRAYGLRWMRLILATALILPLLPFAAISLVTRRLDGVAEFLLRVFQAPARWVQTRFRERRGEIYRIIPREEIRRRVRSKAA